MFEQSKYAVSNYIDMSLRLFTHLKHWQNVLQEVLY